MADQQKPLDQQQQPAPPTGMMRGDAKDDANGFDAARSRAKQRVREDEAQNDKARNLKQKAEAQADQIIKGVDLESLAKEVDEDFSMASKFRNLRTMAPDAEKKLAEIRQRVLERRKAKSVEGGDMKKENPTAGAAPVAGGAAVPSVDAAGKPVAAPAGTPAAGTTAPAAGIPAPAAGVAGEPAKPPAASDEFTKKLDALRSEFDTKLTTQQAELKKLTDENAKLKTEKQKAEDQRKVEVEKQRIANFKTASKAAGIPDDLAEFAFNKAQDVVNSSGVKMTYAQIFDKLKEKHPSIFNTRSVKPEAPEKPAEQPEQKFRVQPGTGSNTGGAGSKPAAIPKEEKGADSWDASRQKLKKRVSSMG